MTMEKGIGEDMIELELMELVKKVQDRKTGEQTIEILSAHRECPKPLYSTLSSFSNQDSGGVILFGLDAENGFAVTGVYDVRDLQKRVSEQCRQMEPVVQPVFTVLKGKNGCVVTAEIPSMDVTERPCYYRGMGRARGSYVRQGALNVPMPDERIYGYEAFRKKYQDDIRVNYRADMSAVNTEALDSYVSVVKSRHPGLAHLPETDLRHLLGMSTEGHPTLVCTLLFSICPQMFYPQYMVHAMVVSGNGNGAGAEDETQLMVNERVEGTIPEILDGVSSFFKHHLKRKSMLDPKTGRRTERYEYPMSALKEAVLNALVHRDYSVYTQSKPVEVFIYKNRIEIKSPGGLYGRMSLDKLGKMHAELRNPALARALETMGIMKNRYSGIPAMQRELGSAGMKEAVFTESENGVCVTFYNGECEEIPSLDSTEEEKLLEFCEIPRGRKEIAEFLGMTTIFYVSNHYINPLVESGRLKMTIPGHPKSKNQKFYRA